MIVREPAESHPRESFLLGPAPAGRRPLTARQMEILMLAAAGYPDKQIARHLGLSARTVQAHFARIFLTWNLHSRTAAVARLLSQGSRIDGT